MATYLDDLLDAARARVAAVHDAGRADALREAAEHAAADAVPGRVQRTWFRAEKTGTYYGQCSELCGRLHAFMPIAVRVVSEAEFAAWLAEAKEKFASGRGDGAALAALAR